jgi:polar amino acid transport system substrate-binding protein
MMNIRASLLLAGVLVFASAVGLSSQNLNVVVPQVSPQAIDVYKSITQAIVETAGKTATMQVVPFARAIYMMETKQADIECSNVQIPDQKKWAALKYDYSTSALVNVAFVLYTNKSKPLSVADLKSGKAKGYKLETDAAHTDHFPFAVAPSTNTEGSLKKVDAGDIDGFIFAQSATDGVLKRLALKNIHRELYDTFNAVFLLQKGARGGPIDAMITDGIAKLKANGKFQTIMGAYAQSASKYVEWQP